MGNESRPVTAAAYIRVSTEDQLEYSPDSQLKKIREYTDSRRLILPQEHIYVDEGISGRHADNRPAFLRMIQTAKTRPRPFDVILVWKFSRFARNRQDSIFYKSMLRRECGVDVVSITEQLSADPTSILIEALLEAMDEYYSLNLAQEVRRGMNEKFSRGGVVTPPPFGYRMGEGVYVPDERTARFVPLIFREFLDGQSCRRIAEILNDAGVCTVRGNPFEARSVRYILSNPCYIGMQRRRLPDGPAERTIVHAAHLPLITEQDFAAAQERLRLLDRRHRREPHDPEIPCAETSGFLLQGLVRCSACGSVLTLTGTGAGRSLQCCRYTRGQCRVSHSITPARLNAVVVAQLKQDFPGLSLPAITEAGIKKNAEADAKKGAEKDRDRLPAPAFDARAANELLHSFISHIRFSRPDNTVQIFYRL